MDGKLYKRVCYENLLMKFFNDYCDLSQFAMTTGSIKTRSDYSDMRDALNSAAAYSKDLIKQIPQDESDDYKEGNKAFLNLIACRLDNIAERYVHLEGKSFNGERYSFFKIENILRETDS